MQALFYMDTQQNGSPPMLERFCENFTLPQKVRPFFSTTGKRCPGGPTTD
jgi:hypothetical protein